MSDLTALTATQLAAGYETGAFTPLDVTHAALEQAVEAQERVNAFVHIDADSALQRAEDSTERWRRGEPAGPVDGVPVTVKDILLQRGQPALKGSWSVNAGRPWDEDAPSVARLRESGAVFLGRTTTPEFAWKGVTDSPRHGVTGNPYAPSRTAGGSSGGSAAAVALGAGPLSLGTDGGGSVRIPASFCGIFAMKPTYGRVPIYPASAFGTLAHVGPMTRDAEDAALLMDVITAPDARDWSQLGPVTHSFRGALAAGAEGVRGLRIAYSPDFGGRVAVDPDVASAVRNAVAMLAELGADVEEADPGFEDPIEAFHTLWFSGAARVTQSFGPEARERLDPGLREVCEEGARRSALDYLAAVDVRMALGKLMGTFLSGSEGSDKHRLSGSEGSDKHRLSGSRGSYDLLVTPTMPITAFSAGVEVPEGSGMSRWTEWTPFSYPFNMTQQPAASVPCGVDGSGLPVGVQLVGARHADALVLSAAHALFEAGIAESVPSPLG